jgi:hypothetical protein
VGRFGEENLVGSGNDRPMKRDSGVSPRFDGTAIFKFGFRFLTFFGRGMWCVIKPCILLSAAVRN